MNEKTSDNTGHKSGSKTSEFNPYTNSVIGLNIKYDHHPELNFDDKLPKPRFARELDDTSDAMTEIVTMMFGDNAREYYEKYLEAIEELTENNKFRVYFYIDDSGKIHTTDGCGSHYVCYFPVHEIYIDSFYALSGIKYKHMTKTHLLKKNFKNFHCPVITLYLRI